MCMKRWRKKQAVIGNIALKQVNTRMSTKLMKGRFKGPNGLCVTNTFEIDKL